MHSYLLVGGWPGSGKSTLSRALATATGRPYLAKDELKEALMDELGLPATVPESRRLGTVATRTLLRVARTCPGAVVDSTWFDYTRPLVEALPGPKIEIRCVASIDTVRSRYAARRRPAGHLDDQRSESELWSAPVLPLGVGPLLEVDTEAPVELDAVIAAVRALETGDPRARG